ncbi:MAG: DEAD/DEAH box helicase [Phycisphaerales bacterium]|nr:DEAD/DEAH box helicase [Phycisphaerales bacterium]
MLVVHANWSGDRLWFWAELAPEPAPAAAHPGPVTPAPVAAARLTAPPHPPAAEGHRLAQLIGADLATGVERADLTLRLPTAHGAPAPSPRLAHWMGRVAHAPAAPGAPADRAALALWTVPALGVGPDDAPRVLEALEELGQRTASHLLDEESGHERASGNRWAHLVVGESARYFAAAARLARSMLAEQRFVPTLAEREGALVATWRPWLGDAAAHDRLVTLVGAMPPSARAAADALNHDGHAITEAFLSALTDAASRRALAAESMHEAVELWSGGRDPHVAWLGGLLGAPAPVPGDAAMARSVRRWLGLLEERGQSAHWRLCVRLSEPLAADTDLADLRAPGDDIVWTLSLALQSADNEKILVDADDVWALRSATATVEGLRLEQPQDLLLAELGRASRLWKKLEEALEEQHPTGLDLTTRQAYEFLREIRPLMQEQGFGVICPDWWDTPSARLGARLQLFTGDAEPIDLAGGGRGPGVVGDAKLGLNALVGYEWKLAIGDTPLTLEEFEKLAAQRAPLVRVDGRWVEVRPEDVQAALRFIRENPGGQMHIGQALRMAYGPAEQTGLPILGIDARGWIADLLGEGDARGERLRMLDTPGGFHGELRPYQAKGLSWLAFLDRLGLGPCLADDMGLGKTVQLLALLVHEREQAADQGVGPTLLVVPMSIVGNWRREAERFAPGLRILVHHGMDRLVGETFVHRASASDLVITTYALAHRDREALERVGWHRVVLDEAQNIKNASAKQSQAVRALDAPRRVALTGTPLENRLSELWSIMDFCNPGFLGGPGEFRRNFSVPIERYHDRERARSLRMLVRPFVLRRLKTDPAVITDLPEKLETKEYCRLTSEQASMYEACVKQMLGEVDKAEGIRRRGIVLTTLVRLKQICNHPAQALREAAAPEATQAPDAQPDAEPAEDALPAGVAEAARSGKCIRLLEMLDEVMSAGASALIFTQFRRMGHLLAGMLRHAFDREVLFLHGGTPQKQRESMVERFQKADGTAPLFVVSLKAGGTGLNLTAASHVFHFDRWWNPAVENQATDRAFRIGQTKTVNVHKFIVSGTLEEKIDAMIESKIALAQDVIGSGEEWLTEMSTSQLREMLSLRADAVADE